LSSNENDNINEHVFIDVAVVFPKLSNVETAVEQLLIVCHFNVKLGKRAFENLS
jgi:hypothetical protein